MNRVGTIGMALVLSAFIGAPTLAQPAGDPEALLGSLNAACQQQANLAACVQFGVISVATRKVAAGSPECIRNGSGGRTNRGPQSRGCPPRHWG